MNRNYTNPDYPHRELGFRVWNSETNNMSYIDITNKNCGCGWIQSPKTHFSQFIGIRDKTGKRIYEGDIVRCVDVVPLPSWDGYGNDIPDPNSNIRTPIQINTRIGVVVFSDGTPSSPKADRSEYVIKMRNGHFDFFHYNGVEVIGNIYQNPEPLRGG